MINKDSGRAFPINNLQSAIGNVAGR